MSRTLFDKIWSEHVIVVSPQGEDLLYVDFNLINEGQSFLAFDQLRIEGWNSYTCVDTEEARDLLRRFFDKADIGRREV